MIFFENERSKVRTLRVSFREIARIFTTLGGFNLGWHWLRTKDLLRFILRVGYLRWRYGSIRKPALTTSTARAVIRAVLLPFSIRKENLLLLLLNLINYAQQEKVFLVQPG